jgi:hypothetical protein
MRYWKGNKITSMTGSNVFVFGSNPEGRHGLGAAKTAMKFGAKYGKGRGLSGNSYALPTKNLKAGFKELCTGIIYHDAGAMSITPKQIKENIRELYMVAFQHPDKLFFIPYQKVSSNLNGYSGIDMFKMFMAAYPSIPSNVTFHESFRGCNV